ncbi:MAG: hypothetical protein CMP20_09365 [Rickettsiales bacterium]|nr:hypothetical protein [Rickettsiales bacterium]
MQIPMALYKQLPLLALLTASHLGVNVLYVYASVWQCVCLVFCALLVALLAWPSHRSSFLFGIYRNGAQELSRAFIKRFGCPQVETYERIVWRYNPFQIYAYTVIESSTGFYRDVTFTGWFAIQYVPGMQIAIKHHGGTCTLHTQYTIIPWYGVEYVTRIEGFIDVTNCLKTANAHSKTVYAYSPGQLSHIRITYSIS